MEAQQCVQLTGTNRSIGLNALMTHAHSNRVDEVIDTQEIQLASFVLRRPGGSSEEPEPDPIPNSAVKLLSADGTMSQDLGE